MRTEDNKKKSNMAPQPRDIETFTANRGMRHKMSFEDIDYILSHQKTVKLPDRRWLQVRNSFEIQNFRGYNEDAEVYEKNRNGNIKPAVEIPGSGEQRRADDGPRVPDQASDGHGPDGQRPGTDA